MYSREVSNAPLPFLLRPEHATRQRRAAVPRPGCGPPPSPATATRAHAGQRRTCSSRPPRRPQRQTYGACRAARPIHDDHDRRRPPPTARSRRRAPPLLAPHDFSRVRSPASRDTCRRAGRGREGSSLRLRSRPVRAAAPRRTGPDSRAGMAGERDPDVRRSRRNGARFEGVRILPRGLGCRVRTSIAALAGRSAFLPGQEPGRTAAHASLHASSARPPFPAHTRPRRPRAPAAHRSWRCTSPRSSRSASPEGRARIDRRSMVTILGSPLTASRNEASSWKPPVTSSRTGHSS